MEHDAPWVLGSFHFVVQIITYPAGCNQKTTVRLNPIKMANIKGLKNHFEGKMISV